MWRLPESYKKRAREDDGGVAYEELDRQQERRLGAQGEVLNDMEFRRMCRNNDVQLRDHQRKVFETMARGVAKLIYVSAVGSGKSVVFALPAFTMPSSMVVVIQPTKSLQKETCLKLQQQGIQATIFSAAEGEDADVVSSVMLVTPEATAKPAWRSFITQQHVEGRIDRVVLDECHEILINADFRPQIGRYAAIMDQISPRQIFMTGTLPPAMEAEFKEKMRLPQDTLTIRSGCTSRNIRFEYIDSDGSADLLRRIVSGLADNQKGIIYVTDKAEGNRLSASLQMAIYSADLGEAEQDKVIAGWKAKGGAILATSALGLGVDFRNVVLVVCVSGFQGIEMVQMMGRAGRNGEPATGILVMPLRVATGFFRDYAKASCRRFVVSEFLDGKGRVCGLGDIRCDLCNASAGAGTEAVTSSVITPDMQKLGMYKGSGGSPAVVVSSQPQDVFGRERAAAWDSTGVKKIPPSGQQVLWSSDGGGSSPAVGAGHGGLLTPTVQGPAYFQPQWATPPLPYTQRSSSAQFGTPPQFGTSPQYGTPMPTAGFYHPPEMTTSPQFGTPMPTAGFYHHPEITTSRLSIPGSGFTSPVVPQGTGGFVGSHGFFQPSSNEFLQQAFPGGMPLQAYGPGIPNLYNQGLGVPIGNPPIADTTPSMSGGPTPIADTTPSMSGGPTPRMSGGPTPSSSAGLTSSISAGPTASISSVNQQWRAQQEQQEQRVLDNTRQLRLLEGLVRKLCDAELCVACYLDHGKSARHFLMTCVHNNNAAETKEMVTTSLKGIKLPSKLCWRCLFPTDWERAEEAVRGTQCIGASFWTKELCGWAITRHYNLWKEVVAEMGAPMMQGGEALLLHSKDELFGGQNDRIRNWYKQVTRLSDGKPGLRLLLVLAKMMERLGHLN